MLVLVEAAEFMGSPNTMSGRYSPQDILGCCSLLLLNFASYRMPSRPCSNRSCTISQCLSMLCSSFGAYSSLMLINVWKHLTQSLKLFILFELSDFLLSSSESTRVGKSLAMSKYSPFKIFLLVFSFT